MSEAKVSFEISAGRSIEISTGKMAKLANGSVIVTMGETNLLVCACSGPARPGTDFFPLQVDYREKYSAAGRFPGGFIKREGRPSDKEILTCRVTDRPLRPLFPKGFFDEVQVQALLLSADGVNDADILCMIGSSAALMLSDLPFQGPIGAVRVGLIDGEFIANPTHEEMQKSEIELIYAGLPDKVIMIEGEAKEVPEQVLKDAMVFANEIVKVQCEAQLELAAKAGKVKKEPTLTVVPEEMAAFLAEQLADTIEDACLIASKEDRGLALDNLKSGVEEAIFAKFADVMEEDEIGFKFNMAFNALVKKTIRTAILEKNYRPDGRDTKSLRSLASEVGVLPIVHGSGLFTRGETQALVVTTLGGEKDAQIADTVANGDVTKKFYLHYNFPNYSVGEVGRIMGPGRREIGHGNLAERSVAQVIPENFPYTVRCVSEVMGSNGSTSMASVCGATLSLMDAGVPIKAPVAGISCGLVTDGNGKELLLTDIIGAEDHFGDMDFKVCGTREGVTGFQLDLKLPGIPLELLFKGMDRNLTARMDILDVMEACIAQPREDLNENAPRIVEIKINPDKIGGLIGPGGKNIKSICEDTGADIAINDDGTVKILAKDKACVDQAIFRVEACTAEAEVGKIYRGKVKNCRDFGAFVEILPGIEGLLHISEMADYRVAQVSDICKEGDNVTVKVIDIDNGGKIRLSRKAALADLDSK